VFMATFKEYSKYDGVGLAQLVANKEISAIELAEAAIGAIERINPTLNAVIYPMFEQGKAQARQIDITSPLAGVPFLIKDLDLNYQGTPTSWGAPFIGDSLVAKADDELMRRFSKAGLVTLGKTNSPEFGLLPTTEGGLYGATKNPWALDYSPGGSSGGASAAVASGMVPMAHANDIGGSIRIPASSCGLVGLKPSRGRMPYQQNIKQAHGMYTSHVISKSVRDSAAVLTHTSAEHLGCYHYAPCFVEDYLADLAIEPSKLRIAYNTESHLDTKVHPDSVKAVMHAANLCQSLGHHVEQARPQFSTEQMQTSFIDIILPNTSYLLEGIISQLATVNSKVIPSVVIKAYAKIGNSFDATQLLKAQEMQARLGQTMALFHQKYDIYLTPTLGLPQFKLGFFENSALEDFVLNVLTKILPGSLLLKIMLNDKKYQLALEIISFTILANVTGNPSISLPLYWNDDRLPIGCLFSANLGYEHLLLRLANQLEKAEPWVDKLPVMA
jgi:amidase